MAICDIDQDGDLDLIGLFAHDAKLVYFENRLNEGWTLASSDRLFKQPDPLINASNGLSNPKEVRCKDLDGDGYPEIIVADKNDGVKVVQNTITTHDYVFKFSSTTISRGEFTGEFSNLIDLNRDGRLDAVYGEPGSGTVRAVYNSATCPAGQYLDRSRADLYNGGKCTVCPSGKYTPSDNFLDVCYACEAGKASNSVGASTYPCVTCSINEYSADGATTCSQCDYPFVSAMGASYCSACGLGKYINSVGTDRNCQECDTGKFSDGTQAAGACETCGADTYSVAGSGACTGCQANYFSNPGSEVCLTCRKGEFYEKVSNVRQCRSCPAGRYNGPADQTGLVKDCQICPKNSYSASTGSDTCDSCPSGTGELRLRFMDV